MRKLFYTALTVVMAMGWLCSCDNFLTREPETKVTNINYWKTETDVEHAVWGLQSLFRDTYSKVTLILRDRGLATDYMTGLYLDIANNNLEKAYLRNGAQCAWTYEYMVVANANLIVDNIHRADLPDDRRDFYLGQALGIRAFSYFYILRLWGDAPLVRYSEDVGEKGRAPWQELADFAIADLEEAAEILPVAGELRNADGTAITSKQYFSRGTAYALLAHLYAWKGALNRESDLYAKGIRAADEVIAGGGYGLAADLGEVCRLVMHGNSGEGILELDFDESKGETKSSGSYMAGICQKWPLQPKTTPATARSIALTNKEVYRLYPDATDLRREEYFYRLDSMAGVSVSQTKGCAYVQKWRHPVAYTEGVLIGRMKTYDENDVFVRLADIILLRAELKEKTGDRAGAVADLNAIRRRAGAREYTDAEGDLADAISLERDRELLLEGTCLRYWDKVRNGTFRRDLKGRFRTLTDEEVADGALYLPVATQAFVNNPAMLQNRYWKSHGFN